MSTFVVADTNKCEDLTPSEDMKKRNLDQRERGVTQNDHRRGCHCSGAFTRQEKKNTSSASTQIVTHLQDLEKTPQIHLSQLIVQKTEK